MELRRIKEGISFLSGPTNLGVVEAEGGAILIDSGIDDDTARRALKLLEGLEVKVIINTHAHADHCGGNAFIKKRTGAQVFAPEIEGCFIAHPSLEPSFLCSASPLAEMRNKFFVAKPSAVDKAFEEGTMSVLGKEVRCVPLPGHSIDHFGLEVDRVLFCGDAFLSEGILEKHPLPLYFDVKKEKETLKKLLGFDADYYVPSHGNTAVSIGDVLNANLKRIERIEDTILQNAGKSVEEILSGLLPETADVGEYFLCRASVMAFLSYLQECNRVECRIEGKKLVWSIP
jgi:glyoxylase-like metal-dependent hydrolase (beta-lactamase superfamily II)